MKRLSILLVFILSIINLNNMVFANDKNIFNEKYDFLIIGNITSMNENCCNIKVKYSTNDNINYHIKISKLNKNHINKLMIGDLFLFTLQKDNLSYLPKNDIHKIIIDRNKKITIQPSGTSYNKSDYNKIETFINKEFSLKNNQSYIEYKQDKSNCIIFVSITLIIFPLLLSRIMKNEQIRFIK